MLGSLFLVGGSWLVVLGWWCLVGGSWLLVLGGGCLYEHRIEKAISEKGGFSDAVFCFSFML